MLIGYVVKATMYFGEPKHLRGLHIPACSKFHNEYIACCEIISMHSLHEHYNKDKLRNSNENTKITISF